MVTNVYRSVEVGGTKDMILGRCNLQRFQDSLLILPRDSSFVDNIVELPLERK